MLKTRIAIFLLALLMLCSTATLFASCAGKKDGSVSLSGEELKIDLAEYTVIYAQDFSSTKTMTEHVNRLCERITAATGATLSRAEDKKEEKSKEILIGATTRKESKKVQKGIAGDGFAIEVKGDKIVIAGTSNMHLVMAMECFAKQYLSQANNSKIKLYESMCAERMASVALARSDGESLSVVCEDNVIVQRTPGSSAAGFGMDVPGALANEMIDIAADLVDVKKIELKSRARKQVPRNCWSAVPTVPR